MENKSKKKAKCDGLICPTCKSANTKKHYSGNKCKECKTVFWTKDEGETANSVKPVALLAGFSAHTLLHEALKEKLY